VDASGLAGGEEILEMEVNDHPAAHVLAGIRDCRSAGTEAMRARMDRNVVEDLTQDDALEMLEQRLGFLDQSDSTARIDRLPIPVMTKLLVGDRPLSLLRITEPQQL